MNILVGLLVAGIAIVGGGFWYVTQLVTPPAAEQPAIEGGTQLAGGQTFAAILGSGQNVQCDYIYDSAENQSSGTVYVADGGAQFRGDFTVTEPVAMEGHVVRVDGYNYVWGSTMPQGIKTAVTAENQNQMFGSEGGAVPEDVTYNCQPWNVDANVFELPSDIEFLDVAAQMQGMMDVQGSADMKAVQCAACEQAGAAREQCRAALGCE